MAYIEKTDKIIKEGWWKKKGGKGHVGTSASVAGYTINLLLRQDL